MIDFDRPVTVIDKMAIGVFMVATAVLIGEFYYWFALLWIGLAGMITDLVFALRRKDTHDRP